MNCPKLEGTNDACNKSSAMTHVNRGACSPSVVTKSALYARQAVARARKPARQHLFTHQAHAPATWDSTHAHHSTWNRQNLRPTSASDPNVAQPICERIAQDKGCVLTRPLS